MAFHIPEKFPSLPLLPKQWVHAAIFSRFHLACQNYTQQLFQLVLQEMQTSTVY